MRCPIEAGAREQVAKAHPAPGDGRLVPGAGITVDRMQVGGRIVPLLSEDRSQLGFRLIR